jgi:Pyruvate/2-oxoacid:ferredoxin oxidoreductase delta subunit
MDNLKEVSRRDFFRFLPRYLAYTLQSFTAERVKPPVAADEVESFGAPDNSISGIARLDEEHCVAWAGGSCQLCYLSCPLRDQAIIIDDQKPLINASFCDGCARCVTACQTVNNRPAIKMVQGRSKD